MEGISTHFNPRRTFVLSKTWDCWSPGTRVDFIQWVDNKKGALVRIRGEQVVVPAEYLVQRRLRTR